MESSSATEKLQENVMPLEEEISPSMGNPTLEIHEKYSQEEEVKT
jgi:hypothetical protein